MQCGGDTDVGVLPARFVDGGIAAVSFDLLAEAEQHIEAWQTGVWMLVGVAVFLLADAFVDNSLAGAATALGFCLSVLNS